MVMDYSFYVTPVNLFDIYSGDLAKEITSRLNDRYENETVRVQLLMQCLMRKEENNHLAGFRAALR